MKTVSILEYDHFEHQFFPSFVITDDYQDNDDECAFDELVIQPSEEWMADYLEWNRFGRLPDDPVGDFLDDEDEHLCSSIPVFSSLRDLQAFNHMGYELTRRLERELAKSTCPIRVAPFRPLYTNMVIGPVASWWHVKDCNYGIVVPVQRLPVSNQLKARLQAFRCHKGMEFWRKKADTETMMHQLNQERNELQRDLLGELLGDDPCVTTEEAKENSNEDCLKQAESPDCLGSPMGPSCSLAGSPHARASAWFPSPQSVVDRTMHDEVLYRLHAISFEASIPPSEVSHHAIQPIACRPTQVSSIDRL